MARIVTAFSPSRRPLGLIEMSYIRWVKISEALARRGHEVHFATNAIEWWPFGRRERVALRDGVRRVPLDRIRWADYDVVKTLFHDGFTTIANRGGADHSFIIAKLGSVVGPHDMPGIYFHGRMRERLYAAQRAIAASARYVTVLSRQAGELWTACHGRSGDLLLVPGAVDAEIAAAGADPYPADGRPRVLFAGNIYRLQDQPEANRVLSAKLNALGTHLAKRGARLYFLGTGNTSALDRTVVTHLGHASYDASWDFMRFAAVGVVVAAGPFMHNNESTKIYHYLRAGLPVVSEAGFPNDHVVTESGLGDVVPNGDMVLMAERVDAAIQRDWDRHAGVAYVLANHTWDCRAAVYDRVIRAAIR
jgi:hypothetical protein